MKILHEIEIKNNSVKLDGDFLLVNNTGEAMLLTLFRKYCNNYPKFYKMDMLSKLGFLSSEILLQKCPSFVDCEHTAIIFANSSSCIDNDNAYSATIVDNEYFPSPALFVYTLPNIVTGEIAIRNHCFGETMFCILENERQLNDVVWASFNASHTLRNAIMGWVECPNKDNFYAHVKLIAKDI